MGLVRNVWWYSFGLCSILLFRYNQLYCRQGTDIEFTYYGTQQGLESRSLISVLQDTTGLIYVGTNKNIERFDGITFEKIRVYSEEKDTLEVFQKDILSLAFDKDNNLWIGTNEGLLKYDPYSGIIVHFEEDTLNQEGLMNRRVSALAVDSKGQVYAGNWFGISVYNPENDKFTNYRIDPFQGNNFSSCVVSLLVEEENSRIFAGLWYGGLRMINLKTGSVKSYIHNETDPNSIGEGWVSKIYKDLKGDYWICTWDGGLCLFDRESESFYCYDEFSSEFPLSSNRVHDVVQAGLKTYWVGTEGGVCIFDFNRGLVSHVKKNIFSAKGLNSNIIIDIFQDKDNGMWLATKEGLHYYNPDQQRFTWIKQKQCDENSIPSSVILSIFEYPNGHIWLGTNEGAVIYQQESGLILKPGDIGVKIPSNYIINKFLAHSNGNIYFFGNMDIIEYNPGSNTIKNYRVLNTYQPLNNVITANELPDGDLMFNYKNYGISGSYRIDITTGKIKELPAANIDQKSPSGYHIVTDKDCYILDEKIYQYILGDDSDGSGFTNDTIIVLCNESVNRFGLVRDKQSIWVIKDRTLFIFYPENCTFEQVVNIGAKYPDIEINSMFLDNQKKFWFTTNFGLIGYDNIQNDFSSYTMDDGLQANAFNKTSNFFLSSSGEVFLGAQNGVNIFKPEKVTRNKTKPKVIISSFHLFNVEQLFGVSNVLEQPLMFTRKIELTHNENTFSFEFAALSYFASQRNQYRYKLEGFDESWIYCGNETKASYTNISPGKYKFCVTGTNSDGIWGTPASVFIRIRPPFWLTWWFVTGAVILLIMAVYMIIKARERRIQHDKSRLEEKLREGERLILEQKERVRKQEEKLIAQEQATKDQRWYNQSMVKLSSVISAGGDNVEDTSRKVLTAIITSVGGMQGALYLLNDQKEKLMLVSSYGLANLDAIREFQVGEGLVGSCFKDSNAIELDKLTESYLALESGLGNTSKGLLLLLPVKQKDESMGVLELSSFSPFTEIQKKFLFDIMESYANYITIVKSSIKMQKLVTEAAQKEKELISQGEELRQNLEEMQSIQDETYRKSRDWEEKEKQLIEKITILENRLNNMEKKGK